MMSRDMDRDEASDMLCELIALKPSDTDEVESLKVGLERAITIIEGYEMDIRNSERIGVDLVAKGFCQGSVYHFAIHDILKVITEKGGRN